MGDRLSHLRRGRELRHGSNPGSARHSIGQDGLSLVLIAGPPRSGTTWLHRELTKGAGASVFLPECTLLTQQIALYSNTLNTCDAQRFAAYFGTPDMLAACYRAQVDRMLDLVLTLNATPETRTLILKDPELSHVLTALSDVMPKHRLIVLMRDPRDVIASMKRVSERKQEAWDLRNSMNFIYRYYHVIRLYAANAGKNARIVRYEDLVRTGIEDLRSFLKLPLPAQGEQKSVTADVATKLDRSDPFFSELYLKPTTTDAVGAYRATLDRDEIAHIEEVFSGVMQHWGYVRD